MRPTVLDAGTMESLSIDSTEGLSAFDLRDNVSIRPPTGTVFYPPKGCGAHCVPRGVSMPSHDHVLSQLTFTSRVAKRAQYEALEFTIVPEGVLVRNASHANPAEHEYLVTVRDGVPVACECPADDRYDGACKHRVGVAIRTPILQKSRRKPTTEVVG